MGHWTDFFPYAALGVKLVVLGVAAYFAIKWHFDKEKELKRKEAEAEE